MNISLTQITQQIIMTLSNFYSIFNDAPQPWQIGFQDSAAPAYTGLVSLHNTIGFYLIIISLAVFWVFFSIIKTYDSSYHPIAHKYLTHGTVLELIWTITPAFILMFVAFPSFRLLYLMDYPI
jgi:cytochrome c oxidase subunit 2